MAGTLVRIIAEVGQTLEVGMLLGVVAAGDASEEAMDAFVASFVPDAGGASLAQSAAPMLRLGAAAPWRRWQTPSHATLPAARSVAGAG